MEEFPVSPLFRPEDQPNMEDVELAEKLARETGIDFSTPAVHQWPSSLRINPTGSRRMVELYCPVCKHAIGCFEDELPYSLDTHHPCCGGLHDKAAPVNRHEGDPLR